MMEFFLSKLWMIIAGLAVMGAILASFGALDDRTVEEGLMAEMASTSNILEEMNGCPVGTMVRIVPDLPSEAVLRIGNGSLWLVRGGPDIMVEIHSEVVAMEGGLVVPYVEAAPGGAFIASRAEQNGTLVTVVQLEKTELSSLTASTNLRASSSVLYR
ncbi:hypothetical protein AOA80_09020 [Methanomassiliicoccales archaeon RumEn M1]|jgi:hypothetical protein|nr:hypothetical protein AOA80_09020 [Methanomassiliicoccales archaeon RumEn M1]